MDEMEIRRLTEEHDHRTLAELLLLSQSRNAELEGKIERISRFIRELDRDIEILNRRNNDLEP